jgi:hypothetical protein
MKVRGVTLALSQLSYPNSGLLTSLNEMNPTLKFIYVMSGSSVTLLALIR